MQYSSVKVLKKGPVNEDWSKVKLGDDETDVLEFEKVDKYSVVC